jgi:hypothetical protein
LDTMNSSATIALHPEVPNLIAVAMLVLSTAAQCRETAKIILPY